MCRVPRGVLRGGSGQSDSVRYVLIVIAVAGLALAFVSPVLGGVIAGGALLAFMFSRSALSGRAADRPPAER
jgi:hypothetical protein